jgi:hypothetical protein
MGSERNDVLKREIHASILATATDIRERNQRAVISRARSAAYLEASSERSAALHERLGFVHLDVLELPEEGASVEQAPAERSGRLQRSDCPLPRTR